MIPIKRIWGITIEREPTDTAKLMAEIERLKDENDKLRRALEISDNMMLAAVESKDD